MLSFYTMEYRTCYLYFFGIHALLKNRMYTKIIQVTGGIFHRVQLEGVS